MSDKTSNLNLRFIGSLRGLAGLWIVLYHSHFLPTPNPSRPLWTSFIVDVGGMAVMLFFVISGFSLMYTYPNRLKSKKPFTDFYLHRFFRIAPLYYFALSLYLIWDRLHLDYQHPVKSIATNLTFTFNLIPGEQTAIVWAGWTIGVEAFFYLIFPFVYKYCKTLINSIKFLILTLIIANLSKLLLPYLIHKPEVLAVYQQWFFIRYMPVFAAGIVLFRIWSSPKQILLAQNTRESLGYILLLISGLLLFTRPAPIAQILGDELYSQAFAFTLLVLGLSMLPVRILVNPVLEWYGKLSYSIYLLQPMVIWHMRHLTARIYDEVGNTAGFFLATLLILLTLSLVAYLSERVIERPMIHFGKFISKHVAAKK